jgi:hypothetical protein
MDSWPGMYCIQMYIRAANIDIPVFIVLVYFTRVQGLCMYSRWYEYTYIGL